MASGYDRALSGVYSAEYTLLMLTSTSLQVCPNQIHHLRELAKVIKSGWTRLPGRICPGSCEARYAPTVSLDYIYANYSKVHVLWVSKEKIWWSWGVRNDQP